MEPYRPLAGKFFEHAAEPTSPLTPFSSESRPARRTAIALSREVIEGSDARVPQRLQADLPEMLWLYFMGIGALLGARPHRRRVGDAAGRGRTAPLVVRAIGIAGLPVMRTMLEDVFALMGEVKLVLTEPRP